MEGPGNMEGKQGKGQESEKDRRQSAKEKWTIK